FMLPSFEEVTSNISALEAWEQLRKHRTRSIIRRSLHVGIGLAIAAIGCYMIAVAMTAESSPTDDPDGPLAAFLFGIVVVICSPVYIHKAIRRAHKKYSRYYKELIVPPLVANMVSKASYPDLPDSSFECQFEADAYITQDQLLEIPIFAGLDEANVYAGEDYFQGKLGVTDFQLCEIHAQKEERDHESGNTNRYTLFEGLVFIAEFHKHFEGTTVIVSRKGKVSGG